MKIGITLRQRSQNGQEGSATMLLPPTNGALTMVYHRDIYQFVLSHGLVMTNSVVDNVTYIHLRLEQAAPQWAVPPIETLVRQVAAVEMAKRQFTNAKTIIKEQLVQMNMSMSLVFDRGALGVQANTIDGLVDPEIDHNAQLFGVLKGKGNPLLHAINKTIGELDSLLSSAQTEVTLGLSWQSEVVDLTHVLYDRAREFQIMLEHDEQVFRNMEKKLDAMKMAEQIDLLWRHPSTRPLLKLILPEALQSQLADSESGRELDGQ